MAPDLDFVAFLREHIRSNWGVELIILMRRDPERLWNEAELVGELRASSRLVDESLERLGRAGLVLQCDSGRWTYRPAAPLLDALCERLEAAYRERPVAVINLLAAPNDPAQALADAFRFREKGE